MTGLLRLPNRHLIVAKADRTIGGGGAGQTTPQSDNELLWPILGEPDERWYVEADLHFVAQNASEAVDVRIRWGLGVTSATGWYTAIGHGAAATGTGAGTVRTNIMTTLTTIQTLGVVANGSFIQVRGAILTGNVGNIALQFAQDTSDATNGITRKAGSILRAERVS